MGDAKRVDLRILCDMSTGQLTGEQLGAVRDAIAEIEAARAAPAPSPTSSWLSSGFPPTIMMAAFAGLRDIALMVIDATGERHEAGPSRAKRLVRYRCAALSGMFAGDADLDAEDAVPCAELAAHAMLAAEREPSP